MTNVVLGTCLCTNGWNGKHCTLEGCPANCNGIDDHDHDDDDDDDDEDDDDDDGDDNDYDDDENSCCPYFFINSRFKKCCKKDCTAAIKRNMLTSTVHICHRLAKPIFCQYTFFKCFHIDNFLSPSIVTPTLKMMFTSTLYLGIHAKGENCRFERSLCCVCVR